MGASAGAGLVALALTLQSSSGAIVRADGPPGEEAEFQMATGTAAHGGALLFILNTRSRVLNVYEAEGGSRATRGLTFVASRKIERDPFVTGYNDKSEYSYQDLGERLRVEESRSTTPADPRAGAGGGN